MVARRLRSRGFTLIELLIVVAIIGLIASILIPNLIDALQKTKQKRTMAEMRIVGTAWMSWLTDQVGSGAAGQNQFNWGAMTTKSYSALVTDLVPTYSESVPPVDGWKHPYQYGVSLALEASAPIGIRSLGNNGVADGTTYTPGAFESTDYTQDIVWTGGFFVRWPAGGTPN